MKKFLTFLGVLIAFCAGLFISYYVMNNTDLLKKDNSSQKEDNKENTVIVDEEEETDATNEESENMKKVAERVFHTDKETYSTSMMDNQEKLEIAFTFAPGTWEQATGTQIKEEFHKLFGKNTSLELTDIYCDHPLHNNEKVVLYAYDQNTDKYAYGTEHGGHGASTGEKIVGSYVFGDKATVKGDKYYYYAKVVFFNDVLCGDTGGCSYNKAFGSYADAKNVSNPLVDLASDVNYQITSESGLTSPNFDKIYVDYKDKLSTYVFEFEKEDNNLVFKNYKKI